jgi:hypothetical protein
LTNIKEAPTIQKNILKYILEEIKYTEFAKTYGLENELQDVYQEYIAKVPIVTYEEFQPWIQRAKEEKDILRPGKITKFSASA